MKKIVGLSTLLSLIFSFLVAGPTVATAAVGDDVATLSSLSFTGSTAVSSSFDENRTYYDVHTFADEIDISFQATQSGAAIRVVGSDNVTTNVVGDGTVTIPLQEKTNQLTTIRVTSVDGSKSVTYSVNVSSRVVMRPELISLSHTTLPTGGGFMVTGKFSHWFNYGNCSSDAIARFMYDEDGYSEQIDLNDDDIRFLNDGTAIVVFEFEPSEDETFRQIGKADLVLRNYCSAQDPIYGNWASSEAEAVYENYLTIANPTVSSFTHPTQVTFGDIVDIKGFGVSPNGDFDFYVQDPETGAKIWADDDWNMGQDFGRWQIGGSYDASVWGQVRQVDLVLEQYDDEEEYDPVVVVKKRVTFVPFVPKNVSVSPAKGPLAGGNTIKIQGFALCNNFMEQYATVTIGGVVASTDNWNCGTYNSSDGYAWDGVDRATVTVPAGTLPGQYDIVLNNGFGPVTLATKYTYGAKPTLTSVAPATVSNAGSSIITLTGTNFGLSGTPTVTIDGVKAPWVQRVSQTKILAMVPESLGKTGAVDLNVISSSGGGALDSPSTITLANATANPTIASVSPGTAGLSGGDTITIRGTGFVSGATGVTIGGYAAPIISSSATELQVELPTGDAAGAYAVVVGTPTGIATRANGFTYTATPGINTITPATIASTTVAASAKVTIVGVGFGTSGTIKVGSAAAVNYTATAGGTTISNVSIPTSSAKLIVITVTPKGAAKGFAGSVNVTAPQVTYFGPDPVWNSVGEQAQGAGFVAPTVSNTSGGEKLRIVGTGFGSSGKVKIGTTLVTPTSYTDTEITLISPAKSTGKYDVIVVPSTGGATVTLTSALYYSSGTNVMSITEIYSAVDNDRGAARNTFDPGEDASDVFVIKGLKLNGTDPSKTRVTIGWTGEYAPIVPISVTATEVRFNAPRSINPVRWMEIGVTTNAGYTSQTSGIRYVGSIPPATQMSPSRGLCLNAASGGRTPAQLQATGDGVFGNSGTVSIDGVNFPAGAVTWSANEVIVNFSGLTANLPSPWGYKTVTFTPTDPSKVVQNFGFTCGVEANVQTKLNGNAVSLTIAAGTSYTASAAMTDPLPNTTFSAPATAYQWQTAEDFGINAWSRNVKYGLPKAAGEYYVRVALWDTAYDRNKYYQVNYSNAVNLVITGNPITFTPKLASGSATSITYKGQLGDGTGGSNNDFDYTVTGAGHTVTKVNWQYRNTTCAQNDSNTGWSTGLPRDVAIAHANCGGDGTSVTSWQIRVGSFEMISGDVDRSLYYLPTYNVFTLTINKKSVTASTIKAEKYYDGTTAVTLGDITVTGAIDGDVVTLNSSVAAGATYSDATAANSKPITLSGPLALSTYWTGNYTLTNPNLPITGKILKADATLKLTTSISSVIMSAPVNPAITSTVTNTRSGLAPDGSSGISPVVITSKYPSVCTYSAGTVTPVAAGDCVIEARQAASTNYNASTSWHDSDLTVEEITIKIYPAPKTLSVIADDITVSTGEDYSPSAVVTGLLDGDNLDGFTFDYYQGSTLLGSAPTAVGTYKIVPSLGTLAAADAAAYANVFKYVSGKLVITPAPPTFTSVSPANGPEAGGNTVVIRGTGFNLVTSILIGSTVIRRPNFSVNGTGTEITFKAPKGTGVVEVILRAGNASVGGQYIYDQPPVATGDLALKLNLKLIAGLKLNTQKITMTGTGLKPSSEYTLHIRSGQVLVFKGTTDSSGVFTKTITMPQKACVGAGKYSVTLTGTAPDDTKETDNGYVVLDSNCVVLASAAKDAETNWTMSGFLFGSNQSTLNSNGIKSLTGLAPLLKTAKTVTIYGYTETDIKTAAGKRANLILAKNRAVTVMNYLKSKGVKAVFKTYGMGGVNPVSLRDQSKNRRVVIEATY